MADRVLVAGCGYVGARLAELLAGGPRVYGLKRDPSTLPAGVEGVAGDVTDPASLDLPSELDALVYAVSPSDRSPAAYRAAYVQGLRNVLTALGDDPPPRVILVTSTGVYGQTDGEWVDEETPPDPADETGSILLEGEAVLRAWPGTGVTLRLGGIYGPGRTRTVRRVLQSDAGCPPPDRYGNRIHRDDAAGALRHLLFLDRPRPVYIGVDREPAALREVYGWIARRGGVPDPCAASAGQSSSESGAAAERRRTNKRCSSERLVGSGYSFRYPTFREGYAPLIDEWLG